VTVQTLKRQVNTDNRRFLSGAMITDALSCFTLSHVCLHLLLKIYSCTVDTALSALELFISERLLNRI